MITTAISPASHSAPASNPRCAPLCDYIVRCTSRIPGHVCMDVRLPGPFQRCAMGHTLLPTTSSLFQRFSKVRGLMT